MRRLLALALPLVAAVSVLPAAAAPVASMRLAEVSIELPAAGGAKVHLTLDAIRADAGDRVYVGVVTCARTCGETRSYSGALPAGALELDPQQARGRLKTSLGGLSVQVSWVPQLGAGLERGYVDDGGGPGPSAGAYRGEDAVATVNVAGRGCEGRATVGTEVVASASSSPARTEPLERLRLRLPARGAPSCTG